MEYARDNPQKVKSVLNQFKPIEHGIKHATNNFRKLIFFGLQAPLAGK